MTDAQAKLKARLLKRAESRKAYGPEHFRTLNLSTVSYEKESKDGLRFVERAQEGLRFVNFADALAPRGIRHTGWFTDEFEDGTLRGVVFRLPHGRLVPGYVSSNDTGAKGAMLDSTGVRLDFHDVRDSDDETGAAYAADEMAKRYAEEEQEYQRAWHAGNRFSELADDIKASRAALRDLAKERRTAKQLAAAGFPAICKAINKEANRLFEVMRKAIADRIELESNYGGRDEFKEAAGI